MGSLEEAGEDNEGSDAEPDSDSLLDSLVMAGTKAPTGIVRTTSGKGPGLYSVL
jgi:hypothetical protein